MISSFLLAGLLGFADAAQLAVIINQNEEQIRQIHELLEKTQLTVDEARQARELLHRLTSGIDSSIDTLKNSKELSESIQRIQQKENFRTISTAPKQSFK